MCRARLAPSAATFAPLLAALQRLHPAEEVAELAVGLAGQADEACGTPGHAMQVCGRAVRIGGRVPCRVLGPKGPLGTVGSGCALAPARHAVH